jgi:hypothetical protein
VRGAVDLPPATQNTSMNTSNEAILALLLELKAELAGLRKEVASLKGANATLLAKVELLDGKLTYLAEEMGMI